ncbi:hypothetical protein [Sporomusa sp.]|uniref:hypothetical protein n=1 Tax=Sporomusa sp. TaxID=2078658 RepID=UPI002B9B572D|nr:hypothetical protein [Sporomusa sp.]HWR42611.1 hypothetical protein [Sporomusa sp.]
MLNKKIIALIVGAIISSAYVIGLPMQDKNGFGQTDQIPPVVLAEENRQDSAKEHAPEAKEGTRQPKSNRYHVAGFDDPEQFEADFLKIQELVAKDNKEEVAEFIQYPLNIYTNGTKTTIQLKEELIASYDRVFTTGVKSALASQKINETFVNYKGVMVGRGEIWFTQSSTSNRKYVIYAINH